MPSPDIRKAFDTSLYCGLNFDQAVLHLSHDLASLTLDNQSRQENPHPATPFKYLVNFDSGTVTCPQYSPEDIRELFRHSSEAETICQEVLNRENYSQGDFAYLWISPGNPESRIGVGRIHQTSNSSARVDNFSGLLTDLSETECLQLAQWANQFSYGPLSLPLNATDLKDYPIFVRPPSGIDPLEFIFTSIIPRPDLYQGIKTGRFETEYQERLSAAREVAPVLASALLGLAAHPAELDYLRLGAMGENFMARSLNISFSAVDTGCGFTNTQLLKNANFSAPPEIFFYTSATPVIKFTESRSDCPAIQCPDCGWEPDSNELAEVKSGTLDECPDCGFRP